MTDAAHAVFDREQLVHWYAEQHRSIDKGVVSIFHLPENAPAREIRLLEVNWQVPAMTPLVAIDFGVEMRRDSAHTLAVVDVTPAQWQAVQEGSLPLPSGWTLHGGQEVLPRGES